MCPPPVATTSDNHLQNCLTAWSIGLDHSSHSRFSGLLLGAQCLECDDDGKQAVGVLSRWNSLLDLSLGYSVALPIHFQFAMHELMLLSSLVDGRVFIFTSTTSVMTSHTILITAEYLNAHFFSVFLFVYVLQVLKALFYTNFRKLHWKVE